MIRLACGRPDRRGVRQARSRRPSAANRGRAKSCSIAPGAAGLAAETSASNDSCRICSLTSLVDFYGFSDKGDRTVEMLEERLMQEICARNPDGRRVFPYVQKHEFDGLLLSDTTAFGAVLDLADHSVETLAAVRRQFATPEDINDDPNGAPGKRIARAGIPKTPARPACRAGSGSGGDGMPAISRLAGAP